MEKLHKDNLELLSKCCCTIFEKSEIRSIQGEKQGAREFWSCMNWLIRNKATLEYTKRYCEYRAIVYRGLLSTYAVSDYYLNSALGFKDEPTDVERDVVNKIRSTLIKKDIPFEFSDYYGSVTGHVSDGLRWLTDEQRNWLFWQLIKYGMQWQSNECEVALHNTIKQVYDTIKMFINTKEKVDITMDRDELIDEKFSQYCRGLMAYYMSSPLRRKYISDRDIDEYRDYIWQVIKNTVYTEDVMHFNKQYEEGAIFCIMAVLCAIGKSYWKLQKILCDIIKSGDKINNIAQNLMLDCEISSVRLPIREMASALYYNLNELSDSQRLHMLKTCVRTVAESRGTDGITNISKQRAMNVYNILKECDVY